MGHLPSSFSSANWPSVCAFTGYHPRLSIALTGTLRAGVPTTSVCSFLGLHPGQFFFIRCSNLRHDVQLLFRPMISSVNGDTFPELDWVLWEDRKVLIFIRTIHMGSHVARYLWSLVSDPSEREKRVQLCQLGCL